MASQNAVSVRISPSGTVVDVYALQTNTNHETDWENRLKQIGPLLNYLLTWRHTYSFDVGKSQNRIFPLLVVYQKTYW